MDIINLIISLLSGAAGGNIAGSLLKDNSFGVLGNSVAGIFGGGIGGYLLQALGILASPQAANLDIGSILANIGSSGVGGAVVLIIASLIKKAITK